MKTKAMTMALLVAVLAASIVLVVSPASDAGTEANPVPLGTVEGITVTGTVEGNGTSVVTYTVTGGELTWAPANTSIGRDIDGWWYGYTFTASNELTPEQIRDAGDRTYSNDNGKTWKSFYNIRDSGNSKPVYLNAWGFINDTYINNAKGGFLTYTYLFDWNGDGTVDQTIYVKMDCTNTTLKDKNGTIVYQNGEYKGVAFVDGVVYATLEEAIAATTETSTIRLLADVDCVANIPEDINTNGFTISHTYDEGTVTTAPTLITEGVLTKTCTVCGDEVESPIAKVTISDLIDAFGSIQGYEPNGTASVSENGVSIAYTGSYTGEDVMNDLARFLGVMYGTGKLTTLTYNGTGYTWEDLGNHGSNWANNGTTLVSVLVDDFRAGRITDSVSLKLGDNSTFTIAFDAEFVAVVGDLQSAGTVTYSQFADAVAVGGDVTLLADVNEAAAVKVTKDVTIDLNDKSLTAKFDIVSEGDVTPAIAFKGDLTKADVQVNGSSVITFGTLKLTVPAGKVFAADGKAITVSEASLEGTVPEGFYLIVTSKATIPAGKTVEGAIWFDTAKDNGITLSSVKAGTSGVTLTKGSVEIVGDFVSSDDGTITVTGIARIVGDSTIDGIELVVPKGASLTVEEGASVTGTGSISNAGTVKVLGDLATALDNTADSVVQVALTGSIDTDKVTGEGKVSFDSIILRDIGTKYYRVGDKVDIPVTVNPSTAELRIDKSVSPSWLTIVDGHIVGTVSQDGSFNVTVVASMDDRESVSESFVLNAVVGVDPDQSHEPQISSKEIVKIAVIILVVLMVICLVTRAFIG